jgi:hypothetical protein
MELYNEACAAFEDETSSCRHGKSTSALEDEEYHEEDDDDDDDIDNDGDDEDFEDE